MTSIQVAEALNIVRQLAEVYTVNTDQVELIRLVRAAQKLMGKT